MHSQLAHSKFLGTSLVIGAMAAGFSAHHALADGIIDNLFIPEDNWSGGPYEMLAGEEVAIAGDLAVVAAPDYENGEGAVFIYMRNNAGTPTDPLDDTFDFQVVLAHAVGLPGNPEQVIVVDAQKAATDGTSVYAGLGQSGTILEKMGGSWQPVFDLTNLTNQGHQPAVMHDGELVIDRAPHFEVLTYQRNGGSWSQGETINVGYYIRGIDFDGTRIVAQGDSAVTVLERSGNSWVVEQVIPVSRKVGGTHLILDGQPGIDGDVLAVPGAGGSPEVAGVHVFRNKHEMGGWQGTFIPGVWMPDVEGDRLAVIGAQPHATNGARIDYATFEFQSFEWNGVAWELHEVITKSEFGPNVEDGTANPSALRMSNNTVLIGMAGGGLEGGARTFAVPFRGKQTEPADAGQPISLKDSNTGEQNVEITFSSITGGGQTTFHSTQSGPPPPSGFNLQGTYYDISTTANIPSGSSITVCIDYSNVGGINETDLRLLHHDGTGWQDITQYPVDTVNDIICGVTNSLSPFAIVDASLAPDPLVMLADLVNEVAALNLAHGIDNSLDAKLDRAIDALTDKAVQNDSGALNALGAFISHVESQSGNAIPVSDGDDLVDFAEEIIDVLYLTIG